MKGDDAKPNRLANEKSPYLLQHAYNPVDWYPWCEEAFEKAKREDKPIFLSIGYSTCHWCHVMAHESFEDNEVAALMNKHFVNIKVDREERPDIDKVYMTVAQMLSGRGGWPLTILMTPEKKPFYAATYISKHDRQGLVGMLSFVPAISKLWNDERERVVEAIEQIGSSLIEMEQPREKGSLGEKTLRDAYNSFSGRFDEEKGGFGRAPKFPSPHNLMLLLRLWKRTGDDYALFMVEKTLTEMRNGGIFDQIGLGFHRYSTDRNWLLPHFEKMLYDQAMLTMAYTEVYQATKNPVYAEVVREIITYVTRDLSNEDGAFYSAEDADSEGEEGKFYVWSEEEIRTLLNDDSEAFAKYYNIRAEGNFNDEATGESSSHNVPHITSSVETIADSLGTDSTTLSQQLEKARMKLFEVREKRIRPHRDEKILTDWNGLMIAAIAKAARALGEEEFRKIAETSMNFILENMRPELGTLHHMHKDGESGVHVFLDDYAFLVWGLLELYETTFNIDYLETAKELNSEMIELFWDEKHGGLFFTSETSEELLIRQKEVYDGAIPSGNSVAMLNIIRIARLLGDHILEDKALEIAEVFATTVESSLTGFSMLLSGLDFSVGPAFEIVIAGDPSNEDTKSMLTALRQEFIPNKVVLLRPGGEISKRITKLAPYTKYHEPIEGKATAHVCIQHNCKLPTTDLSRLLELIGIGTSS